MAVDSIQINRVRNQCCWQRAFKQPLVQAVRIVMRMLMGMASLLCSPMVFATPDLTDYELVFSDEFEASALDTSKWNSSFFWGPFYIINGEEQYYVDALDQDASFEYSPFSLSNGILTIEAVPTSSVLRAPDQPTETDAYWSNYADRSYNEDYDPDTRNYLSGILTSAQSYNPTHGYFEARLKFPGGQGLWPAFWLLNSKYVQNLPEIDIVEFLGHQTDTVHHTLHYMDITDGWQPVSSPTYETTGSDFTADFHTYGVAWDPKKIRFYVDGIMVKEVTDSEFLISAQSMYILLNLAVGGTWPESPDANTQFPARYEIDYVRAYERKSIDTITQQVLDSEYQLMFSDEFNGSSLDESQWNTSYLWGPYYQINNEEQFYLDKYGMHRDYPADPFEVSAGTLKIRAEEIEASNLPAMPPEDDPEWDDYPGSFQKNTTYMQEGGWTPGYTSGVITSYDEFKFVNGYAEARIKMPAGAGLWPAFWLLNGYYVGAMPEMDIVEVQGEAPSVTHHTYHYHTSIGELVSDPETYNLGSTGSGVDTFHVYGFQWDRERMVWYIDGIPVREITGPHVSQQLSYVILNLAVGGNFVGDVGDNVTPAEMEVDWVRIWQLGDVEDIPPEEETPFVDAGNTGNGIAVVDNAEGEGYIMYSEQNVFDRFSTRRPLTGNAEHLIAVRYVDGRWEYNNNSATWTEFTPLATDRLLATVNFSTDVIESLAGQSGIYEGMRWGYASGDISFTANQWQGRANAGEIGVSGTRIEIDPDESDEPIIFEQDSTIEIGNVGKGIAIDDAAQGAGYIMYSEQSVFDRFSSRRPLTGNAEHLIAVRFVDGNWEYNNNSTTWTQFTPAATDRLLATVNFDTDVIESLVGQSGIYEGMRWGYASGDVVFTTNQWQGVPNTGEIGVAGTQIEIDPDESDILIVIEQETTIEIGNVGKGIAIDDAAQGAGYILYSEQNVFERFSSRRPLTGNAEHFIAVRFVDGNWEYNNNSTTWTQFTPVATDRLLATVNFDTDVIGSLVGQSGIYEGVRWGYASGDVVFTTNQWQGVANSGEIGVAGTQIEIDPDESDTLIVIEQETTVEIGNVGRGIAIDDAAQGTGYVLYSAQNVFERFSAHSPLVGNAEHFIAVRFVDGGWEYNNNSAVWAAFSPVATDRLMATVDFDTDVVEALEGESGVYEGVELGYVSGDVGFVGNQWQGRVNAGEIGVLGEWFGY